MKVALMGSVSSSVATLRGLIRGGVDVAGVLGLDAAHAAGVSDFCDLRPIAEGASLPFHAFRKVTEPGVEAFLKDAKPDLLFVVGLSQLVPESICDLAPAGAVGFHPTPLPKGRGRAPVAWTILLNEPAAANLFFLTDAADAGDIIVQRPVEVRPDDYARNLIDRTNVVLERMVFELADALKTGNLPRRPQDHSQATWYARRTPADGRIDWADDAKAIDRLIRATSQPYPGAFTTCGLDRLIVWRCQLHKRADHVGTVGQIVRVDPDRGLLVQCGRGLLWLTEVQRGDGPPPAPFDGFREGRKLGQAAVQIEEQP